MDVFTTGSRSATDDSASARAGRVSDPFVRSSFVSPLFWFRFLLSSFGLLFSDFLFLWDIYFGGQFTCLFVYLSDCLLVLFGYLSDIMFVSLCLSVCLPVYLSSCLLAFVLSTSHHVCLSLPLCLYLPVCLSTSSKTKYENINIQYHEKKK